MVDQELRDRVSGLAMWATLAKDGHGQAVIMMSGRGVQASLDAAKLLAEVDLLTSQLENLKNGIVLRKDEHYGRDIVYCCETIPIVCRFDENEMRSVRCPACGRKTGSHLCLSDAIREWKLLVLGRSDG